MDYDTLIDVVKSGDINVLKNALVLLGRDKSSMNGEYNLIMAIASDLGYIDIVKLMLDISLKAVAAGGKGVKNYIDPLENAAYSGHMDIVLLMLEAIEQSGKSPSYNEAMACAALGGHMDIVKLMLEKGANDYNWAMEAAAERGSVEIIQLMLDRGANDYNKAMKGAAYGGHLEILKWMENLGANDYNKAMERAAEGGHMDIVCLMLEKGANKCNFSLCEMDENMEKFIRQYLQGKNKLL